VTAITAPRDFLTAYRLGPVVYVPHYRRLNEFVGPGYHEKIGALESLPNSNKVTYTADELLDAGAVPEPLFLLDRAKL